MAKAGRGKHNSSPFAFIKLLLKDYLLAIGAAAAVALLLRVFIFEAFRIPTSFMAPTLLAGDHIFVNKIGKSKLTHGDVIVFSFPNDPKKDFIKRVIGMPGDQVEIKAGAVFLNLKQVSQPDAETGASSSKVFTETMPEGRQYKVQWADLKQELAHMPIVTVPPGQIFVLGDNRTEGQDSRQWGFLPIDSVKGKAWWIWFSTGTKAETGQHGVRWGRIFRSVL